MDTCDPETWIYRAEGNKHIVVSNDRGQVLRLKKRNFSDLAGRVEASLEQDGGKHYAADVLEFQQHIALPMMRNCTACHAAKKVKLSPTFVQQLSRRIQERRPDSRKHKGLDCTGYALLMQDYCFFSKKLVTDELPPSITIECADTFSVEIKPKRGFISASNEMPWSGKDVLCQFCCNQMFRVHYEKKLKECSLYCPLDLFSGCRHRMRKALLAMLATPQNNIRVFRNGQQEYPPVDDSSSKVSNEKVLFNVLVEAVACRDKSNLYNDPVSTFIDLLCDALLLPVTEEAGNMSDTKANFCAGYRLKHDLSKNKNSIYSLKDSYQPSSLPCTSILGLILAAQKLNQYSIKEIKEFHDAIMAYSDQSHAEDELNLDAPYTSNVWQKVIQKDHLKNLITDDDRNHQSDFHPL